jgi:hypothetical protein
MAAFLISDVNETHQQHHQISSGTGLAPCNSLATTARPDKLCAQRHFSVPESLSITELSGPKYWP